MNRICKISIGLLVLLALLPLLSRAEPPAATVDFDRDIKPIFAERCLRCHGPERSRSGLRLDGRVHLMRGGDSGEPAIVPGKGADSHLVKLVSGQIADKIMPPTGKPLTGEQIARLRLWIDQGAKWPGAEPTAAEPGLTSDHWSLQALASAAPPNLQDAWIRNPIDAFILERLHRAKLQPAPPADRVTLIRRLYLDMHGLPPTPEQVQQFVADARPDAYERLVEDVLASPRYGERWAQHWLDVVRYAETHGFETNTPREQAWPYRDYVIAAFNSDRPYDRFVQEQLCGDALGVPEATGFLVAGPQDQVKSPDPALTAQQRQDELNEIINATCSTFLGLTVSCARCHNHKFDPILQKDYYAVQAVFAGVRYGNRPWHSGSEEQRQQQLAQVQQHSASLQEQLHRYEPLAFAGRTLWLDDDDTGHVDYLVPRTGQGVNPPGPKLGERDFAGDGEQFPNISGGHYSWWNEQRGKEVMAYRPGVAGRFALWLSWGCGWVTHVTNARYVLDRDGDLATSADQTVLATIDQQKFADGSGDVPSRPLWSGLYFAGVHELQANSRIVLRAGTSGPATTADVLLLQECQEKSAEPRLRLPVHSRLNVERFAPIPARFVRFTIEAANNLEPCIDELEIWSAASASAPSRNVALAVSGAKAASSGDYQGNPRHRLEHIHDGRYSNERSWISNQVGRGWIQIELPATVTIDRITWGRDRTEKYQDRTPTRYRIEVASSPGQWQLVAAATDRLPSLPAGIRAAQLPIDGLSSEQRQELGKIRAEVQALQAKAAAISSPKQVFAGVFQQPGPTHRLYRGDPLAPREVVVPDTLSLFGSLKLAADAPEQQRRLALAQWITRKDNPLTARVLVNRLWHYHFGTGLVNTPSDFGKNGDRPSHPELLDWLARTFQEQGWSMKQLHRLIVLSSTYRQASRSHKEGRAVDASNRLLWHFPQRRLEAEAIRDSILAVSGVLDLRMGGPGFSIFQPNSNYVRNYIPKEEFGPEEWRRMIYVHKVRMEPDAVFGAFDCPDNGQPIPRRSRSTTPIQALNLFNSTFLMQQANLLAQRVQKEAGSDLPAQVQRAFQLALGRPPTTGEAAAAVAVAEEHGVSTLCRVLFNTNEFLFLP